MTSDDKSLLKRVFACIDHTSLSATDNYASIGKFCRRALELTDQAQELDHVAAVCVYAPFIAEAKDYLKESGIKVAAVAGGFPHGQMTLELRIKEIQSAAESGADEIDVIFPLGNFFAGEYGVVEIELQTMRAAAPEKTMKVILETGELKADDNIRRAAELSVEAGFDFIKTSTGKISVGATPEAAKVMLEVLKNHHKKSGKTVGLKVSGGISTPEEALVYARMAQQIMGDNFVSNQTFRIGASRLTENLFSFLT